MQDLNFRPCGSVMFGFEKILLLRGLVFCALEVPGRSCTGSGFRGSSRVSGSEGRFGSGSTVWTLEGLKGFHQRNCLQRSA